MRVLYAVVCEAARERPDGRADLIGIFRQLYAPGFPAQQDHLTLALEIEWDAAEFGQQAFRIDLLDPSGSPALTINGHSEVGQRLPGEPPQLTRLQVPLQNVVFPAAGSYEFELQIGGQRQRLTPLHLIEMPEAQPGG